MNSGLPTNLGLDSVEQILMRFEYICERQGLATAPKAQDILTSWNSGKILWHHHIFLFTFHDERRCTQCLLQRFSYCFQLLRPHALQWWSSNTPCSSICSVFCNIILSLCVCPPGPMASTEHGRGLEETATVRKMAQQNPVRGGQTHRPAKRRRPRPRLSHKGPMPF